jgi:hypothetical protein
MESVDCPACGQAFMRRVGAVGRKKRYCSSRCRSAAANRATATQHCQQCGAGFTSLASQHSRYCSPVCAHVAQRVTKGTVRHCERCSSAYEPRYRGQRYCGVDCQAAVCAEKAQDRAKVACASCGTRFTKRAPGSVAVYCSLKCATGHSGRLKGFAPPKENGGTHLRRSRLFGRKFQNVKAITIFRRDGWICGICGEAVDQNLRWPDPMSASLDHIVPLSLGGHHVALNLQCSHLACNVAKGAKKPNPDPRCRWYCKSGVLRFRRNRRFSSAFWC